MVDKPDPGEQYGGAGTGARIREALKNVADLLSRTQADEEENLRLGMQSYIRQNAPPPTYKTPNMLMRGAEAAAKYTVMGAEEGFKPATEAVKKVVKAGVNNTATSLKDAYANIAARPNLLLDTVGGIGRPSYMTGQATPANIEGLTPNYLPNVLDREFNKAGITLKNAANVGAKELNKFVSNVTYEAKNPPTGFYAPALATPTTTSMPAKPKQTQSEAFVAQSNFDTSDPEVNAYKNSGPREYGRIDYISYAADLLGSSETPYPDVAYAVASSETNRGRTTQIKGQIPLKPNGSYQGGAQGPWQFIPETAMHPDINLLRKDPQTGKWIDDRGDPIKSARAFVVLTNMNRENFINNFKREPTKTELYLGHLLGSGDLKKSLQNEAAEPTKLAKTILPKRIIEKNLRVPDEQKAALAEKISIKDFLDMHRNAFNTYIKEYPSWRAARQGKELDIGVNQYRLGGLIGPGGMRMRPYNEQPSAGEPMRFGYTPPVDRPILPAERPMPQYQEPPMPQRPGAPGLTPPRFDFMERRFPSYQEGGMIGPGGMPVRPAGVTPQQAPTMASDQLESEIQRMMQQNPQAVQQIQQEIMSAMQTGELTPQELNMMVQLATLAAQNPQMYPQIRQFAIQQGIASEEDLGQEYDQGLVFTILLAARASQQQAQGGASPAMGQAPQVPQAAMQPPVASMMSGGALPQKSQNADGSVPIIAHEGEYVIPKEIVLQKGTDFFDKLIGKGPNASGNAK